MNILMILLRIIHIFSAVFWVGFSFANVGFLAPTAAALGPDGQKFMGYLVGQTRLLNTVYAAATLTMLSGLIMYGILSGFRLAFMTSSYGLTLGIGGLAGLTAWAIAIFVIRQIFIQMGVVGGQIRAQGGPPTPEQGAAMRALGERLGSVGRVTAVIMAVAVLGMAIAQYVFF